jgi:hypothetical protein
VPIPAAACPYADSQSVPEQEGAAHVRWQAAQAIAALQVAYEKPENVPDRLWAEAVNRTVDWVGAE